MLNMVIWTCCMAIRGYDKVYVTTYTCLVFVCCCITIRQVLRAQQVTPISLINNIGMYKIQLIHTMNEYS